MSHYWPGTTHGSNRKDLEQRIAAIRRFNRLYTKRIGVLQDGFVKSPFSLTQARVLYELSAARQPTATELATELGLDRGLSQPHPARLRGAG